MHQNIPLVNKALVVGCDEEGSLRTETTDTPNAIKRANHLGICALMDIYYEIGLTVDGESKECYMLTTNLPKFTIPRQPSSGLLKQYLTQLI